MLHLLILIFKIWKLPIIVDSLIRCRRNHNNNIIWVSWRYADDFFFWQMDKDDHEEHTPSNLMDVGDSIKKKYWKREIKSISLPN